MNTYTHLSLETKIMFSFLCLFFVLFGCAHTSQNQSNNIIQCTKHAEYLLEHNLYPSSASNSHYKIEHGMITEYKQEATQSKLEIYTYHGKVYI